MSSQHLAVILGGQTLSSASLECVCRWVAETRGSRFPVTPLVTCYFPVNLDSVDWLRFLIAKTTGSRFPVNRW